MDKPTPEFTDEQMHWLCYHVDEWYLEWKHKMVSHAGSCKGCDCDEHRLGYAKELLKYRLCKPLDLMVRNKGLQVTE